MFVNPVFLELLDKYKNNKLAHAYLFETNDLDLCVQDLQLFLKQINCSFDYKEKCVENCNLCTLFDTDNLPSYITVNPDGNFIKKEQILDMMNKFSTKPVYSRFNMYVIKQAEKLNSSSANTILKFLEEPSENILGFFITNNKESVLTTIRSRCQIINCFYNHDDVKVDSSLVSVFESYLKEILDGNGLLYNREVMSSLYSSRSEWHSFFENFLFYLKDLLDSRGDSILVDISSSDIISFIFIVEEILKHLNANGNVDLVLDRFVLEMEQLYE